MAKKELYKDWIVRYYGSHNDIPPGHTDGELTELIRCKDCKHYRRNDRRSFIRGSDCSKEIIDTIVPDRDFCSKAERKEE